MTPFHNRRLGVVLHPMPADMAHRIRLSTAPYPVDRRPGIVRMTTDNGRHGNMRALWTVTKYILAMLGGAIVGLMAYGATLPVIPV